MVEDKSHNICFRDRNRKLSQINTGTLLAQAFIITLSFLFSLRLFFVKGNKALSRIARPVNVRC